MRVQHLRSTQRATYDHDSFFGYAMNLKNGFGQIMERSFLVVAFQHDHVGNAV